MVHAKILRQEPSLLQYLKDKVARAAIAKQEQCAPPPQVLQLTRLSCLGDKAAPAITARWDQFVLRAAALVMRFMVVAPAAPADTLKWDLFVFLTNLDFIIKVPCFYIDQSTFFFGKRRVFTVSRAPDPCARRIRAMLIMKHAFQY